MTIYMQNTKNIEYLSKIDKAIKQVRDGNVVKKTIEELEKMTNK